MSTLRLTLLVIVVGLLSPFPARAAEEPVFNNRKMSEWMTVLKEDPTPRKRRAAVVALGQIASENRDYLGTALLSVGKALKDDANPAVREQAAVVLGQQKVEDGGIAVAGDLTESLRVEKEPAVKRMWLALIKRRANTLFMIVQRRALKTAEVFVTTAQHWNRGKNISRKIALLRWRLPWALNS